MTLEVIDDSRWTRVLAIVAHPDDLEYGASGAVARWTSRGCDVSYVLATRGEAGLAIPPAEAARVREDEQRRSAAVVGVDNVLFLDHRDGVVEYGLQLRRDMAAAVRQHRPQVVLTVNHRDSWGGPSFNMADHRNVGLAVLDGVRDAANPWIFPELGDEGLEPWGELELVLVAASPLAGHAVDITGFLDRGIASLEQHRSYLDHTGTDADGMLRSWAEEGVGAPAASTRCPSRSSDLEQRSDDKPVRRRSAVLLHLQATTGPCFGSRARCGWWRLDVVPMDVADSRDPPMS